MRVLIHSMKEELEAVKDRSVLEVRPEQRIVNRLCGDSVYNDTL